MRVNLGGGDWTLELILETGMEKLNRMVCETVRE